MDGESNRNVTRTKSFYSFLYNRKVKRKVKIENKKIATYVLIINTKVTTE